MNDQYPQFLMYQLAVAYGLIENDLEYDTAWGEAGALYVKFLETEFNVDTKSEYDCIVNFLLAEKKTIEKNRVLEQIRKRKNNRKILITATRKYFKEAIVNIELPRSMTKEEVDFYIFNSADVEKLIENGLSEGSLDSCDEDEITYTDSERD